MQNHQQREESIEVYIKAESPLDVLTARWL